MRRLAVVFFLVLASAAHGAASPADQAAIDRTLNAVLPGATGTLDGGVLTISDAHTDALTQWRSFLATMGIVDQGVTVGAVVLPDGSSLNVGALIRPASGGQTQAEAFARTAASVDRLRAQFPQIESAGASILPLDGTADTRSFGVFVQLRVHDLHVMRGSFYQLVQVDAGPTQGTAVDVVDDAGHHILAFNVARLGYSGSLVDPAVGDNHELSTLGIPPHTAPEAWRRPAGTRAAVPASTRAVYIATRARRCDETVAIKVTRTRKQVVISADYSSGSAPYDLPCDADTPVVRRVRLGGRLGGRTVVDAAAPKQVRYRGVQHRVHHARSG